MIAAANAYRWVGDHYPLRKSTNGWWLADCAFCGKRKKFAFNFAWSYCKCWSCKWRGSIVDFVMATEDLTYGVAHQEVMAADGSGIDPEMFVLARSVEVTEVELPEGYTPLIEGRGKTIGERAIKYLSGRGFDIEYLDSLGFGYVGRRCEVQESDDYFGYIVMPIKQDGRLRYFIGRDFVGGFPKYKNPAKDVYGVGKDQVIYNADAFNIHRTVYVMEGILDAATLSKRATATLGWSWSPEQVMWMIGSACRSIVIIADKGFYDRAVANAVKLLDHKRVYVVDFDQVEDGKDVNEIGRARTRELIDATEELTYERAFEVMGA